MELITMISSDLMYSLSSLLSIIGVACRNCNCTVVSDCEKNTQQCSNLRIYLFFVSHKCSAFGFVFFLSSAACNIISLA